MKDDTLRDSRSLWRLRFARLAILLTLVGAVLPLAALPAAANHRNGELALEMHVEISPEQRTDTNPTITVRATLMFSNPALFELLEARAGGVPINIDFEMEGGPNDVDGVSPETPDATCNIPPAANDCGASFVGFATGNSLIRGWIDHDNLDETAESDRTEGRFSSDLFDCHFGHPLMTTHPGTGDPLHHDGLENAGTGGGVAGVGNAPQQGLVQQGTNNANQPTPPETCLGTRVSVIVPILPAGTVPIPRTAVYQAEPGGTAEPDQTDVVLARWLGPPAPPAKPPLLSCDPETQTRPVDGAESTMSIVCSAKSADGAPVSGKRIDGEMMGGANDPDDGANTSSSNTAGYGKHADFSERAGATTGSTAHALEPSNGCSTGGSGACTITIAPAEGEVGSSDVCFWIDDNNTDGDDNLSLGGAEEEGGKCDEESLDTLLAFDNKTDVVRVTWAGRNPEGLDARPETATAVAGTTHTVTATVFDQFGQSFRGGPVRVNLEFVTGSVSDTDFNSPSTPDRFCDTSATTGSCTISYRSTQQGKDLMCLWFGGTPGMTGTVTDAGCDGEVRQDQTSDDGAPAPVNDDIDVIEVTWGAGGGTTGTPTSSPSPGPTGGPGPCQTPIHSAQSSSYFPYGGFNGGSYAAAANVLGASNTVREIVTGAGEGGGSHVVVADRTGAVQSQFFAYDPAFTGGVRVATADINGDGVAELVTAPGAGGGPHAKVLTSGGQTLRDWMAYDPSFVGGVFVAGADVNGDGDDEVITGAGEGGSPHVRVWDFTYSTSTATTSISAHRELFGFMAYEPSFTGGVRVAGGQVTNTATGTAIDREEIVTAPGAGREANIRVFRESGGAASQVNNWNAYGSFAGGAYVALGNYDNPADGVDEVITGAGAGGGPHVIAWRATAQQGASEIAAFFAYAQNFTGGVRVASADVDACSRQGGSTSGTNEDEIVTAAGPGSSQVRVFR